VIDNEWLLGFVGASSILFGALLLIWPLVGLLTLTLLIGGYAFAVGIMLVSLSLRLRRHHVSGTPFGGRLARAS
jgi:uncharacterized membrane protein HdeD (DUF308 family)